jgi:CO/xanthine dehydrogenase Mo-binding subunit
MAAAIHSGAGSMGAHGPANFEEIYLKMNSDGTINASVGFVEMGQGSHTVIAQIVAEELHVDVSDIRVITPDTDNAPRTMGPWGSRTTFIGGNAAHAAAADMKRQLLETAKEILDAGDVSDLVFGSGEISVKRSPERSVRFCEVTEYAFKHFGKTIIGKALYNPPNTVPPDRSTGYGNPSPAYSFCTQAVEVEVDPETGKVNVMNVVAAHDVGKAINPMLIEGQIDGGVSMGIGYAILEEIKLNQGTTLNPGFSNYKMMNAGEMPNIKHILIETMDPSGPYGAKGVGEIAMVPTAPAVANAIYDAVGVRIKELPITQEKIVRALKRKIHRESA